MPMQNADKPMTEAQREQIKLLCREADIPDKSGKLYTSETAQVLIDDLRQKAATTGQTATAGHRRDW